MHLTFHQHPPFGCANCTQRFFNTGQLYNHLQTDHNSKAVPQEQLRKNQCEKCGKQLASARGLQTHLLLHKHPQHKCSECGREFRHITEFRKHLATVHSIQAISFLCAICQKQFGTELKLLKHLPYHQSPKISCHYCGQTFFLPACLKDHLKFAHNRKNIDNYAAPSKDGSIYKCSQCGSCSNSRSSLKVHLLIHKPPQFKCSKCQRQFRRQCDMEKHMRNYHSMDVPLQKECEICGKTFKNRHYLQSHQVFHGEAKFPCTQCHLRFYTSHHLAHHSKTKHKTGRPNYKICYFCSICSRQFRCKEGLSSHLRLKVHSQLECPVCSQLFTHPTSLRKHRSSRAH